MNAVKELAEVVGEVLDLLSDRCTEVKCDGTWVCHSCTEIADMWERVYAIIASETKTELLIEVAGRHGLDLPALGLMKEGISALEKRCALQLETIRELRAELRAAETKTGTGGVTGMDCADCWNGDVCDTHDWSITVLERRCALQLETIRELRAERDHLRQASTRRPASSIFNDSDEVRELKAKVHTLTITADFYKSKAEFLELSLKDKEPK